MISVEITKTIDETKKQRTTKEKQRKTERDQGEQNLQ